jgi:uncharacterized protein
MSRSEPPRSSIVAKLRQNSPAPGDRPAHGRSASRNFKIRLVRLALWLHIYVSMFGLAAVLFFSVTGVTLNHPDWFGNLERRSQADGQVELRWLHVAPTSSPAGGGGTTDASGPDAEPDYTREVAKLDVVEFLRKANHVRGALADFRVDENECSVSFKGPGYAADAFIDRASGHYNLIETSHGFVAVINDLHKGRDTGPVWSAVVDISAVVLTIISLTGLILLFFLKLRRRPGLVIALVGTVVLVVIGWLWVP